MYPSTKDQKRLRNVTKQQKIQIYNQIGFICHSFCNCRSKSIKIKKTLWYFFKILKYFLLNFFANISTYSKNDSLKNQRVENFQQYMKHKTLPNIEHYILFHLHMKVRSRITKIYIFLFVCFKCTKPLKKTSLDATSFHCN